MAYSIVTYKLIHVTLLKNISDITHGFSTIEFVLSIANHHARCILTSVLKH